ncbi:methyltransferase domain-containing protein [Pandoraea sp.]|uniref:tRNA (guanine(46)-N(7))-methyltransferase TrmB n=1 Tax=Pandoraea sp. TaxID=1883445 RepID=UPI0011F5C8C3|nr:methyltransferase domain-containing protein [Pandoraea sp.]TAL55197.1 MAG: methyltransferase domain-containing protein [Pandoraea sp.]TAM18837.1 MAG: methyltransferase domain-containing protein [Pandoraea sp.]
MFANSRPVSSEQVGAHERLVTLLERHRRAVFRKPLASYSVMAFEQAMQAWRGAGEPALILDAGCGVGESTLHLATRYPDHFVVGVDQSAHRLQRGKDWWRDPWPENFIWIRADLVDFWRQLALAQVPLARHYILYPNPWPKLGQLARRWHGHAVFPTVAALGGVLECRSNWSVYIEEFAFALQLLNGRTPVIELWRPSSPITPFERKYLASGHALHRCVDSGV